MKIEISVNSKTSAGLLVIVIILLTLNLVKGMFGVDPAIAQSDTDTGKYQIAGSSDGFAIINTKNGNIFRISPGIEKPAKVSK